MKTFNLETERLVVRPPQQKDLPLWHALQSDPDVMIYVGNSTVRTLAEVEEALHDFIKHYNKYGFSLGSVFEKESGAFVGRAGLIYFLMNESQPYIEIAYMLHKRFWGKGYATELAKAFVEWGFENLDIDRLVAVTHQGNLRSQHVLKKAGLHYVKEIEYAGRQLPYFEIHKTAPTTMPKFTGRGEDLSPRLA